MSKKDFELIANVIRTNVRWAQGTAAYRPFQKLAEDFAAELCRTNPRFDRERFLRACRVEC